MSPLALSSPLYGAHRLPYRLGPVTSPAHVSTKPRTLNLFIQWEMQLNNFLSFTRWSAHFSVWWRKLASSPSSLIMVCICELCRVCGGGLVTEEVQRFVWDHCIAKDVNFLWPLLVHSSLKCNFYRFWYFFLKYEVWLRWMVNAGWEVACALPEEVSEEAHCWSWAEPRWCAGWAIRTVCSFHGFFEGTIAN